MTQGDGRQEGGDKAHPSCPAQTEPQVDRVRLSPLGHGANTHQKECGGHERNEDSIEVGRSDRELSHPESIDDQGVQSAQKNGRGCHDQQDIVGQEHGLSRDQLKSATNTDLGRTPSEQKKGATDDQGQQHQNEQASSGVGCERVNRAEDARANQERSQKR